MTEIADIIAIKDYLKKLQKIINFDHTFSFAGVRLVKKSKIDDILCCVYAKLPESYKKMLKTKVDVQRYNSVICYGMLTKLLARKFFLDKNMCILHITEINKLLSAVILGIERDINNIEKVFEEHNI